MKKLIIAISSVFMLFVTSAISMELRPAVGLSASMGVFSATGTEKNYDETGSIKTTTDEHGAFAAEFGSVAYLAVAGPSSQRACSAPHRHVCSNPRSSSAASG